MVGVDLSAFLPPLEDAPNLLTGESTYVHPFNCTYRLATVQGKPTVLALPTAIAHPYNYEKDKIPEASEVAELNVLPVLQKETQNIQFPELGQRCEVEIVQPRAKPFGIELDDFLPVKRPFLYFFFFTSIIEILPFYLIETIILTS